MGKKKSIPVFTKKQLLDAMDDLEEQIGYENMPLEVSLISSPQKRKSKGTPKTKNKGGIVSRKAGGTIKKQAGGLPQGYNARLDESLAARHPAVRGNLAARRAESMGMERALGRGPYSGARTMAKKGGSVRRKKGSTVSRKSGGKIMQGYKAGGKV